MNRQTYREARALIRANGEYALRWMPVEQVELMKRCARLAHRAPYHFDALAMRAMERARQTHPAVAIRLWPL